MAWIGPFRIERPARGRDGYVRLCGGVSAVHLLKLTACTIISKPQNTGLLVNQKASYRRKQTQQTSRRAAGGRCRSPAAAHRRRLGQRRAGRRAAGTERRDGLATQQVVARCRPVRMPGRVARSAAGASGTLEHEHCDEAVGGARPAIGTGGMLGSAGLRRGQSLEMRPCFV